MECWSCLGEKRAAWASSAVRLAICLVAFARKEFAVEAGLLNRVEHVGHKAEFVLRYGQPFAGAFHG